MYNRIVSFINKHTLLSLSQYGCWQYKNTTDDVTDLLNFVTGKLNVHTDVGALFIDVAKAFDLIDHIITLKKLEYCGFRRITNLWFKSYFSKRMQYVASNELKSSLRLLHIATPQGSILGTLVFILYINDSPLSCPDAHFVLFADDTICLAHLSELQSVLLLYTVGLFVIVWLLVLEKSKLCFSY